MNSPRHRKEGRKFERLVSLCEKLRSKDGCMWDRKQSHRSLIPCLKEEAGEVIEAIENEDYKNLKEELGDLIYQVVFHSALASEKGEFSVSDVLDGIEEKLIRRHPHVFGDAEVSSVDEIIKNWKEIKKKEKKR